MTDVVSAYFLLLLFSTRSEAVVVFGWKRQEERDWEREEERDWKREEEGIGKIEEMIAVLEELKKKVGRTVLEK